MPITNVSCTFLGTGTSAGVPVIACDCDVCTSSDPKDNRLRCSICIQFTDAEDQERVILIDTSPDLRQQVIRENINRCDAILFTHNHVDHTFGLDEVRLFNVVMQQPIDIYAERHTLDHLSRVFQHVFDSKNNVNDSFVANLVPKEIHVGETLDLYGMLFTPMRLIHGRLPILGFHISKGSDQEETLGTAPGDTPRGQLLGTPTGSDPSCLPLAYCTDVSSIPPETWPQLGGLNTLVLDMLRFRHHPTHLNLDQAIEIATQVGAHQTWFTHMTHDIGHGAVEPTLPEGMSLAFDGLRI